MLISLSWPPHSKFVRFIPLLSPSYDITWRRNFFLLTSSGWGGWVGWDKILLPNCFQILLLNCYLTSSGWVRWVGWGGILPPNCFQIVPFVPPVIFDHWNQIIPSIIPSDFVRSLYHLLQMDQIACGLYHFLPLLPFFWMVVFYHGLPRILFATTRIPSQSQHSRLRIFRNQGLHNISIWIFWIGLVHTLIN